MTRSERLRPIIDFAAAREQDAVRRLGEAGREVACAKARLTELETYRSEYARQLEQRPLDAGHWNQARAFLAGLNRAIAEQARRLRQAERREVDWRREWLRLRSRTRALGEAAGRYARAEALDGERREQRDADERAGRRPSEVDDG